VFAKNSLREQCEIVKNQLTFCLRLFLVALLVPGILKQHTQSGHNLLFYLCRAGSNFVCQIVRENGKQQRKNIVYQRNLFTY
jgi:hypothetical protein